MVSIDKNDNIVITTNLQSDDYAQLLNSTVNVLKSSVTNEHKNDELANSHLYYLDLLSAILPTDKQAALMFTNSAL